MRSRLVILGLLICGILLLGAQVSVAAVYQTNAIGGTTASNETFILDDSDDQGSPYVYGDRPFKITNAEDGNRASINGVIYTYCVQLEETFSPGESGLFVYNYSTFTEKNTNTWYLTGYTAWVYSQYLNQIGATTDPTSDPTYGVGGSPYGTFTKAEHQVIQKAIWAGMTSTQSTPGSGIGNYSDIGTGNSECLINWGQENVATSTAGQLKALGLARSDYDNDLNVTDVNDIRGVRVAQIRKGTATVKQDQLLLVGEPFGNPQVPEPTTLAIWSLLGGVGLGLAHVRRRRA